MTWASLGHFDSLLVSMAGLVLAAGVVYFAAEAVWTILAGKIRGDALEAGRYRHGIFLCDQGLLLRWRRTATWLPIGCIQQFTESRSRMELDDMRRRGVSNTKDRWLALLWKSGAESGTAIYPCRLPLPVFERLRGWFRDRGIKRTPLQR